MKKGGGELMDVVRLCVGLVHKYLSISSVQEEGLVRAFGCDGRKRFPSS